MRIAITFFILFFFISSQTWAATWWIRDGGGSIYSTSAGPNKCNGHTNAVYSSGASPNCAVSNPMLILGAGCGNYGGGPCTVSSVIASGDVVNIVGDSDNSPGSQAQYAIGSGVTTNAGNCSSGINCTMANPPAGSGPINLTIIQGFGTHTPQLYGINGVNQVLEGDNSYVQLNNMEITDHSSCIYGFPASGTVDGFPLQCVSGSGPWAKEGVYYGGTGSSMENMWIHGIAHNGTDSDNLSGFLSYNNIIAGNAFNGDAPGNIYSGSTVILNNVTWQNDTIVYNGCGEHYPMHSSDPYDTANYHDCYEDNNSGQGDGLGNQAGSANCAGNLQFINDDVSFNQQDGLDFLHCQANGNFYMYRTRTEGNMGQQVKINMTNWYIENSLIVGDCYYFHGQTFQYTGGSTPDYCRAGGDAISVYFNGGSYNIDNSTILVTGPATIDAGNGGTCTGATLNLYNDNFIGGYNTPQYGNNALATWIDEECTTGSYTLNEDYNHVWNYNGSQVQCGTSPGTHDQCADTNAGTTTTITTSMVGPNAYYAGNDLGHLLYPKTGGQLPGNANSSLTLTGTSNDFNNVTRPPMTYSIGSYTLNSCVATGGACFEAGECCNGGTCTNNICVSGSCTANGNTCITNASCCSSLCSGGACVSCLTNGNACSSNASCCSNICSNSFCSSGSSGSGGIIGDVYEGSLTMKGVTAK